MNNGQFKILIVDDTPKNIQVAAGFLQDEGYTLSFATSGDEALNILRSSPYDLVLLDVVMPSMDGYTTCRRIKSENELAEIPVIFLTVKDDSKSVIEGFEAGGVDYITKPFNPYELLARVKTHLALKHHMELNRKNDQMLLQKTRSAILSELISNIAHQWRQPLTVLGLQIADIHDVIRQEMSKDKVQYVDKVIQKSETIIQEMSRTITNFSRYFNPEQQKDIFNLADVFSEVRPMTEGILEGEVRLVWDVSEDVRVSGYTGELIQALMILLNNARDALEDQPDLEERIVWVSVAREDSEAVIRICDNGHGIDNDMVDKMFDPYSTTKHQAMNTGLGLYMAKIIVENNMDGKIIGENAAFELDGHPYSGACFTIRLPAF